MKGYITIFLGTYGAEMSSSTIRMGEDWKEEFG